METRFNNLKYEHKHGKYGWHAKTVKHRKIVEKPCEANICIICNVAKSDMEFDEFLGGNICNTCHNKREIRNLRR